MRSNLSAIISMKLVKCNIVRFMYLVSSILEILSIISICFSVILAFFFFFQAEDGIRDGTVTGVQTCALPIYAFRPNTTAGRRVEMHPAIDESPAGVVGQCAGLACAPADRSGEQIGFHQYLKRSEERRVGKECRSRWWVYREKVEGGVVICGDR